ncbi:phage late control D family protein [Sodalis sp. (in: enterobacteria)]|uniref:phage late control D family protein n=1 Tax=Sodalis sp. (in: enterobacteria) TaxID=1898979 RepID=UPI003F313EF7
MSLSALLDSTTGGHTPDWRLSVDGVDITGNIAQRLMSLTLTDNRGFEADQLDIELDDSDRSLLLPRRGANVALSLGWKETGLINKGTFTVDEIEHSGAPDRLTIRARSADFRASLNVQREASYHNTTLGDVVKTLAARHKLTPVISQAMARTKLAHSDQSQESDGSFLTRLAREHGAVMAVKQGKMLFFKQGHNQTLSGKPLPALTITRQQGDSHTFTLTDRDAYTGVVAHWLNTRQAKPEAVSVRRKRKKRSANTEKQGDYLIGSEENVLVLRHTYASKHNAERAARANWERLQRGVATFAITLARGRAELAPEMPVKVSGFKREIDQAAWTLVTVTHTLNSSGFTTALELEVKIDALEME